MDAPGSKKPRGDSGRKWITEFAPFLTIGMQLAFAVVGFFFLGRWLDDVYNTAPWLMILGLILGTTGGFVSFFRSAILMAKKENELEHKDDKPVGREGR